MARETMMDYRILIGKTVEKAEQMVSPMKIGVSRINGEYIAPSKNVQLDRLNVWIQDGKIIGVTGVG